jgi:hypothetical protein
VKFCNKCGRRLNQKCNDRFCISCLSYNIERDIKRERESITSVKKHTSSKPEKIESIEHEDRFTWMFHLDKQTYYHDIND